jgi:hypothetical protein
MHLNRYQYIDHIKIVFKYFICLCVLIKLAQFIATCGGAVLCGGVICGMILWR